MKSISSSTFLRGVLLADAITCIATGLLLTLGSSSFQQSFGLQAKLLQYAGISLFPFAAFVFYLATKQIASAPLVWAVILLNGLWTIDSILLLLSGWVEPTAIGSEFILFQAVGVAILTGLEYIGLRKSVPSLA